MVAGLLLLVCAQAGVHAIPQGPSEFAYAPFTPGPLPFSPMRGFTAEQLAEHLSRLLLGTPGLLLLLWGVGGIRWRQRFVVPASLHPRLALAASAISLLWISYLLFFVYQGRAIIDDELTYRMQAMQLAEGLLGRSEPALHFLDKGSFRSLLGVTGKYYPGEPLLQLPGAMLGYPALGHLPLAALTLLLAYRALKLQAGTVVASWTVVLIAASPMFLLTTPTGQSVSSSLFCVVAAGYGYVQLSHGRPLFGALVLGAAVSLGMAVRPQSMAPVGLVLVIAALIWLLGRRRRLAVLALLSLLGVGATLLLWYNKQITGSYITLPWSMIKPVEQYGFGEVWEISSYRHTPLAALQNLGVVALRFNGWWLGWPSSLLLLWLWWRHGRPLDGGLIWLAAGLALILFEGGYYSTGVSDTGAMYHYELLVPAAVLGANLLRQGFVGAPRFTVVALVCCAVFGSAGFLVYQTARIQRLVDAIHQPTDELLSRVKGPAVVYYDVRCSETLEVGWIHSAFPRRYRSRYDRIVTYPRPPVAQLAAHRRQLPGRSCWYYRRDPQNGKPRIHRCEEVKQSFVRPYADGKQQYCLSLKSTAERNGWYDPWNAAYGFLSAGKAKR